MKFTDKYKKPKMEKKYFRGATLEDVEDELNKQDCWGIYVWDITWTYNSDNKDKVTEVIIEGQPTITMPIWKDWSKADRESQKKWDIMWVKLKRHEEGHHKKTLGEITHLKKKLTKDKKGFTGKTIGERMNTFLNAVDKANKDYDKSTKHGQNDGVKLT
jgi:predicted secreted Zn-dependent protease